ncbi:unnamed protein product [Somion occarium]|uniref:Uncharacterized protein n=1 Tax=Somion occarium TaxID=3059160 RepID=A0ABP1E220_9APHY
MSPVASPEYVPNMGQCDFMIPPCDISFLYPDKEPGDVTVSLWVNVPTSTQAFRHLHITRERDKKGIPCDHLTNWGPMTKAVTPDDLTRSRLIPLGDIPLAGRQRLEEIASATPIRVPDGAWNNQDWVLTVLETALDEGVLPADFDLEEIKVCALSF